MYGFRLSPREYRFNHRYRYFSSNNYRLINYYLPSINTIPWRASLLFLLPITRGTYLFYGFNTFSSELSRQKTTLAPQSRTICHRAPTCCFRRRRSKYLCRIVNYSSGRVLYLPNVFMDTDYLTAYVSKPTNKTFKNLKPAGVDLKKNLPKSK